MKDLLARMRAGIARAKALLARLQVIARAGGALVKATLAFIAEVKRIIVIIHPARKNRRENRRKT